MVFCVRRREIGTTAHVRAVHDPMLLCRNSRDINANTNMTTTTYSNNGGDNGRNNNQPEQQRQLQQFVRERVPKLLLSGVERRGVGDRGFHRVGGQRSLGLGNLYQAREQSEAETHNGGKHGDEIRQGVQRLLEARTQRRIVLDVGDAYYNRTCCTHARQPRRHQWCVSNGSVVGHELHKYGRWISGQKGRANCDFERRRDFFEMSLPKARTRRRGIAQSDLFLLLLRTKKRQQ